MNKNDIIAEIAKERLVEDIVYNVGGGELRHNLRDLVQDIYLILLNTDETKLEVMYTKKQLRYYIARIVVSNIRSVKSRYYYNYKVFQLRTQELNEGEF